MFFGKIFDNNFIVGLFCFFNDIIFRNCFCYEKNNNNGKVLCSILCSLYINSFMRGDYYCIYFYRGRNLR